MFPQQQIQQQLLQLQHLIQQQQQQGGRALQQQQQQQLMNLRPPNQAPMLGGNPMLQRALLLRQMQGNMRGFSMAAPGFQQFFPQAARHSLLGPPPVGVQLKNPRLGFPNLPFQQQNRPYNKDFQRPLDRKREVDQAQSSRAKPSGPKPEAKPDDELPQPSEAQLNKTSQAGDSKDLQTAAVSDTEDEPAAKRIKLESDEENNATEPIEASLEKEEMKVETSIKEEEDVERSESDETSLQKLVTSEGKTTEVLSAGGTLKVTIQQSCEDRAISTTGPDTTSKNSEGTRPPTSTGPELAPKFFCYICNANCYSQQNFEMHMKGIQHHQRLVEIQHMSNACLVTLLPKVKESFQNLEKEGEKKQRRWCSTCQIHFTGDLIKHRRTPEHKLAKHSSRPFCTVCSRHFKSPRKFVEHMKTPEHKQKVREARGGDREPGGPEDPEDMITVDAVGCFGDDTDDEEEEEEEEDEGGISEEDETDGCDRKKPSESRQARVFRVKEVGLESMEPSEQYNSDTLYGSQFVVPVAGFLCRLCHKFYHSESTARLSHCRSLTHFQNVKKYKAERSRVMRLVQVSDMHLEAGQDSSSDGRPSLGNKMDQSAMQAAQRETRGKQGKHKQDLKTTLMQETNDEDEICGVLVIEDDDGSTAAKEHSDTTGVIEDDSNSSGVIEDAGCSTRVEDDADSTAVKDIDISSFIEDYGDHAAFLENENDNNSVKDNGSTLIHEDDDDSTLVVQEGANAAVIENDSSSSTRVGEDNYVSHGLSGRNAGDSGDDDDDDLQALYSVSEEKNEAEEDSNEMHAELIAPCYQIKEPGTSDNSEQQSAAGEEHESKTSPYEDDAQKKEVEEIPSCADEDEEPRPAKRRSVRTTPGRRSSRRKNT
ncbi:cip1-interacting zinc finger protein isoform X2 [Latimeria chalumnae]|uniref:cip1-interacting zinc finger protein isoform X2 n=1 Tax=Latimeria chalumnae TaxID=7897 RepID=UPI00313AC046